MPSSKSPVPRGLTAGVWGLSVIALAFAAIGVWVGLMSASVVWTARVAEDWTPVPARVLSAEVLEGGGSHARSRAARARYEYTLDGRTYVGERVGLHQHADNVDDWAYRVVAELQRSQREGRPVTAWVNPQNPKQALLDRDVRWRLVGFEALFAIVFTAVGVGLVIAGQLALRRDARERGLLERFPGEPWRLREDWSGGRARAEGRGEATLRAIVAVTWNLVSAPILWILPRELERGNRLALVGLLFPAVGIWLAVTAFSRVRRWLRLRRTTLHLDTLPARVGGRLRARLETDLAPGDAGDLRLTLCCVQHRPLGSRGGSGEEVVQRLERTVPVPAPAPSRGPGPIVVPVELEIPAGSPPSTPGARAGRTVWRLEVAGGGAFAATFEVPVF